MLTWLCTSLSAGFALVWWSFLALFLSCFKHLWHWFLGCLSLLCGAFHALFLSLKLVCSRCATLNLATVLLSARGRHHCTWRLSCCLLEVGLQCVLDLVASHRPGSRVLLKARVLQLHNGVLCNLHLFLKLFDITSTRSFQDVLISSGMFFM